MSEGFQKAQREVFAKQAKEVDIIITTALIRESRPRSSSPPRWCSR